MRLPRLLCMSLSALLLAWLWLLLTPLFAAACGGLFSADSYTEQSAERLIFTVDSGQVTLYEQVRYTGSPRDFAWVLPVPDVPQVDTAPVSLFQDLDRQTAPRFFMPSAPSCEPGLKVGAPGPAHAGPVNVYSGGTAGPYSYNVIGSADPQALIQWLTAHNYKIPAESRAEIQIYVASHMLFLALRLQGNADVQNMTPVKITYHLSQPVVSIPLRMATPMGKEPLGVLVWIFAQGRYVPQNYHSLQLDYNQLGTDYTSPTAYPNLVSQAVNKAGGHGFVTEYAQPTSQLFANDQTLTGLKQRYRYLTRLYTNILPSQITLDPGFIPQAGLPDVNPVHEVANPAASQPLFCPFSPLVIGGMILGGVLVIAIILVVVLRRRARIS